MKKYTDLLVEFSTSAESDMALTEIVLYLNCTLIQTSTSLVEFASIRGSVCRKGKTTEVARAKELNSFVGCAFFPIVTYY